jgi:hypothetical protein
MSYGCNALSTGVGMHAVLTSASGHPAGSWENGRPVWMQPLAAAQAEAKTQAGGEKADLVAKALAAAAAARKAAEQGAALYKDHWQPEGQLQVHRLCSCAPSL